MSRWKLAAALVVPALATFVPGPTAAEAAPTAATVTAAVAPAFSYIRSTCIATPDGNACVSLLGNGRPSTYEVRYILAPKAGSWMQPIATARWDGKPYTSDPILQTGYAQSWGVGTRYQPFCTSTCARVTTQTTWTRTTPYLNVYSLVVDGPHGRREVAAGVTPVLGMSSTGVCTFETVSDTYSLTSTNDNHVYYRRNMTIDGRAAASGTATMTDDGQRFYTARYSYGKNGSWSSPTFLASWRRHSVSPGLWTTPLTLASDGYVTAYAGPGGPDC